MALIIIREQGANADSFSATVSFADRTEYPITIRDPFTEAEEEQLEWYFEKHLEFPFLDKVKAQQAAESITGYGERLFQQVFADPEAYARYKQYLQAGLHRVQVEIAGNPGFQALHWEALKDPKLPQPLALQATMVRKNLTPQVVRATVRPSPTINLLVVTARPFGARDVGYRTISRPLVESLRQAGMHVKVDILRPGTYKALVQHLEEVKRRHEQARDEEETGSYYHLIHFDVHGAVLTSDELQRGRESNRFLYNARYARSDLAKFEGHRAFLFLEGEQDNSADPVEAGELANLLLTHQIPIAILNACQSGKPVERRVDARETSLGSRLVQAGVQVALAMGYSVTVSAAEILMNTLYRQLFTHRDLPGAILQARQELQRTRARRVYFNQQIDLEDWLLPVVYQNSMPQLRLRDFTPEESQDYYSAQANRYTPSHEPGYGFIGRDLDILQLEKRLLTRRNIVLVRGMGGAGKTTLLQYLGTWWQTTGLVEQVFYFGYDEHAWTRQQLLDAIARKLLSPVEYVSSFQPLGLDAQQAMLTGKLRAQRHLMILDNLESITGSQLAIQHTLPEAEQQALHHLLHDLAGGRTLVLLGSRSGEAWLAKGTFDEQVYDLGGLDPEAASQLAERILERYNVTKYRQDREFSHLLTLLDGFPLALEVVLSNLARQTPGEVLEALQAGGVTLNTGESQQRTENILRCIDYSHSNLSPEAQQVLLCLAPFTSVLNTAVLEAYTGALRQQPLLASLPFERWAEVLQEAVNWGLLSPDPNLSSVLRLQPTLPYFLRHRLQDPDQAAVKAAIETAFRKLYDQLGDALSHLLKSKEPEERQLGQLLTGLEYENLQRALDLALQAHVSILNPYNAVFFYLNARQEQQRGLEWGESVLRRLQSYPAEILAGPLGVEFVRVIHDIASRQLHLKQLEAAHASYQQALALYLKIKTLDAETSANGSASIYHQLGRVAQEQRQWLQAEQYYQQALQIKIEYNDRYEQASTYHQLGRVAQEQRQWQQAEQYYQQALLIYIEYHDRHTQASTYHELGIVAQEQRQWQQAEQYYQQALQIKIEYNDRYAQARTYLHLGVVAQEQQQWQQAERYYQQALLIYIEFNDRYEQAGTFHGLGIVAQEQRQWQQAEQYYQQALQIYMEYNDRHKQASIYHQLGRVAEEQRQWPQARDYYLQALETFISYKDTYIGNIVLRSLARLWRTSTDASIPVEVASRLGVTPAEAQQLLSKLVGDQPGEAKK